MAKEIRSIKKHVPNQEEEQTQAVAHIVKELADNGDAILSTIHIIRQLHEIGVLDAVNAMLEKRNEVSAIAIQQINQPTMHNIMKNGMNAFKFLGSLQPEQLQMMMDGVNRGLERSTDTVERGEEQSLWGLGKSMRNPEIRSSLTTMVAFLQGMGEAFSQNHQRTH